MSALNHAVVLDKPGQLFKFFVDNNRHEDEEIETFEISTSPDQTFGDLIQKIMVKRSVERNVISLSFKNELTFFDGSSQNESIVEDKNDLSKIFEYEKNEDGTVELIYKGIVAEGEQEQKDEEDDDEDEDEEGWAGIWKKLRTISSSQELQIFIPLTGFINGVIDVKKQPFQYLLKRRCMFSKSCVLSIVYKTETDGKGNKWFHLNKYLIPSKDSQGQDQSRAPIFIQVVNGNEYVIKVNDEAITGIPQSDKIPEPPQVNSENYEKWIRPGLQLIGVAGSIAGILAIPGVL